VPGTVSRFLRPPPVWNLQRPVTFAVVALRRLGVRRDFFEPKPAALRLRGGIVEDVVAAVTLRMLKGFEVASHGDPETYQN